MDQGGAGDDAKRNSIAVFACVPGGLLSDQWSVFSIGVVTFDVPLTALPAPRTASADQFTPTSVRSTISIIHP